MPPTTITGRYVVERAVGRGGMGTVWLCRDEVLGRSVAVKEVGNLPGESTSDLARALREARSSASLNHRNVVSVYDAVEDGDHNWLVMEYVPSRTLAEILTQEGSLSPERVAWIGAQAADGLAAAHARGTMHRDVKPGNILVTEDDHVKITDFGIARTHGDDQLTQSGIVTGTPTYFAPELAKGAEPTLAADVWALGASLYAAVEGRGPYPDQPNAIALLTKIASEPAPPPERAAFLTEPINRMMDRDPSTRWTMADVAHTLHRLHEQHRIGSTRHETVALTAPTMGAAPSLDPTPEPTPAPVLERTPTTPREAPRPNDDDRRGPGRYVAVVAAVAVLLLLAAAGIYLINGAGDDNTPAGDEPARSASAKETGSDEPRDQADAEPKEEEPPADPSDPEQFAEKYYSYLPDDTQNAWSLLSPAMQDKVGSYGAYRGFWSTISAVAVDDTTPVKEEGAVDVELTYTSGSGTTQSETRRIYLKESGSSFVIARDEVI